MNDTAFPSDARSGSPDLWNKIQGLEARIDKLESRLSRRPHSDDSRAASSSAMEDDVITIDGAQIEMKVVEYGLSWLGSLVLLFGITFLMVFIEKSVHPLLASLTGYLAAVSVFFISRKVIDPQRYMSFMFGVSAFLLAYIATLRLHFLTPAPLIAWEPLAVVLLLVVTGFFLWDAFKKQHEFQAVLGILLMATTSIVADKAWISHTVLTLMAATSLWMYAKRAWRKLQIVTLILVYLTHTMWLFGNPIMGHAMTIVTSHSNNFIFLFLYGVLISYILLLPKKGSFSDDFYTALIILNAMGFSFALFINVVTFFPANYSLIFLFIAAFCFVFSVLIRKRITRFFDAAIYMVFSFMALSAAIYGWMMLPGAFALLCMQSFLVVSIALWYRSKIISVMNTMMFYGIIVYYLYYGQYVNWIDFVFPIIAFATARVVNWQKERLSLKTELIRNAYLLAGFVTLLLALYKAVPARYVTLSWTLAAALFFVLSILLSNVKYRWIALATLLVTAVYLFVVDLSHMEAGSKVIAFLFLALISIGASLYYTRSLRKKKDNESSES